MTTYSLDSIVPSKLQQQFEIHPLYWNNPLNRDEQERRQAINYCQQRLALADALGALCLSTWTNADPV
jgi:endonuclease IV